MQVSKMLRSFIPALAGLRFLLQENNARFHLLAAIIALSAGFYLRISAIEWVIILILIGLVLAAETFNTAIEKLCDFVSPEYNEIIGKVKDLAAAAVLIIATAAVIIGIVIFLPKILNQAQHSIIQSFTHSFIAP